MRGNSVTYAQLLETNNLIQVFSDESYWLCLTRTTQESKLFPVPSYMLLSYLNAYYRYPSLLRKVETRMSAEECGDHARNIGSKIDTLNMGWCVPGFYLMGRELLINLGLLRPEDGVEDLIYVMDFWKRIQLSYHRNDGHMTNKEFGHRSQFLPERTLQVFEADLYPTTPGDPLHTAANKFMATVSQYQFLSHCECRIGISNQGPYNFGEKRQLIVRDFMDLGEGDYPWLDGIAPDVAYNNLTVPMVLKDTNVFLMDDWGSFESEPEFRADNIAAIGLYTSDPLTEGYIPVAMESREALTATFARLQSIFASATTKLWERIAAWSRAEMIDAGALVYFSIAKDLSHVAGTYEQSDWMEIDQRARRFVPLLNDEYGRDTLTELLGLLSLPSQQLNEYTLSQHNNKAKRTCSLIPYGILATGDYTASAGPIFPGDTALAPKRGRWRTSRGLLTQNEYNAAVRDFTPTACTDRFRFLDDFWIKYNSDHPEAQALYRLAQQDSRILHGRGAGLKRTDIARLKGTGTSGSFLVLHGLAIKKFGSAAAVAAVVGVDESTVADALAQAVVAGEATAVRGTYMVTPDGQTALKAAYPEQFAALRANPSLVTAYDRFEAVNAALKQLITDWQVKAVAGESVPNDHGDKAYDARIIDRLGTLHEQAEPVLAAFAAALPRLDRHRERLEAALARAEDGAVEFVSGARIDSYHTVWFELHEDLLRTLDRTRME